MYKRVQNLWRADRKKCAKLVLSGEWKTDDGGRHDGPTLEQQEAFWSKLYSTPSQPDQKPVPSVADKRQLADPISGEEIKARIKKQNNASAPGPDNITVDGSYAQESPSHLSGQVVQPDDSGTIYIEGVQAQQDGANSKSTEARPTLSV